MADPAAIADHGMVGDLRTCALVATDGTVDWFCPGRFDAPSVFAGLLDPERGGGWRVATSMEARTTQFYVPDTTVLVTRFLTGEGVMEVQDFMPVLRAHDPDHRQRLVRRVRCVRGRVEVEMTLRARPDYGRSAVAVEGVDGGVLLSGPGARLGLSASAPLSTDGETVRSEVSLQRGESALFVLEVLEEGAGLRPCAVSESEELVEGTVGFWRAWLARSTYTGRWREMVNRSALTLKMLTHEPTGAVVAAPTTSLPERIGGERNWDYRYVWMRDAAFTLYALLRLGFTDEAGAFFRWLAERLRDGEGEDPDLGPLRVLYDIDGDEPAPEQALDHLAGHGGSRPVRVGNGAVRQLQLDIYGELIDSVYLFDKYGDGIGHDAWQDLRRVLDWVLDNWQRPDAGMWEVRSEPASFTTSRLMCWVAVERMIRMARRRGLPGDIAEWGRARDRVYDQIMSEGWSEELGSFVGVEGGTTLDAGLLLLPMVKLVAPSDPRFLGTLAAVEERLVSDSLVFRYDVDRADDGVPGEEGTFSLCTFWYVEALTRTGRLEDARLALEKMFTYANHLGLYAEQVGLAGDQLGNFPQGFTHLALISAAINLDRALPT